MSSVAVEPARQDASDLANHAVSRGLGQREGARTLARTATVHGRRPTGATTRAG